MHSFQPEDPDNVLVINDIAYSTDDKIYAVGYFRGSIDFDPTNGLALRFSNSGSDDAFIARYNQDGFYEMVWVWGGIGDETAETITIDNMGNIYVLGNFIYTVDFNPGSGIFQITSYGSSDIYLSKFDSSMNYLRTIRIGGADEDTGKSVCIDHLSNIFITGFFRSTIDLDPDPLLNDYHVSNGGEDIFLVKISQDSGIDHIWGRTWGWDYNDRGYDVSCDNRGNAYIAGFFEGIIDFDPGLGEEIRVSLGEDGFIIKLLENGYWY